MGFARPVSEGEAAVTGVIEVGMLRRVSGLRRAVLGALVAENFPASGAGQTGRKRCLLNAPSSPVVQNCCDDQHREQSHNDSYGDHGRLRRRGFHSPYDGWYHGWWCPQLLTANRFTSGVRAAMFSRPDRSLRVAIALHWRTGTLRPSLCGQVLSPLSG